VNPILAGVALVVVGAAVVIVSARDARIVGLATAVALLGSAVLTDPLPTPTGLAARAVGAVLAGYLLWITGRDRPEDGLPPATTEGSRIGWPAEILLAGAAAIVGFAVDGLGAPALGPDLASAAGFAVAALAMAPVLTGRDVFRVGLGLLLLIDGVFLVRAALGGTPSALEELLTTGLIVTIAGAVALLGSAARRDGVGGFGFAPDSGRRMTQRAPDAHPVQHPDG
jgi:hypothetical protein